MITGENRIRGLTGIFLFLVLSVLPSGIASAHVTVKPSEVISGTSQIFTVVVPNEKAIPTIAVELKIPEEVQFVTPTVKAGWVIDLIKDSSSEQARITAIIWRDGTISEGLREEFTFSAKVPAAEQTELKWRAYQTYENGEVVAWDAEPNQAASGHGEQVAGPLSLTKVVADSQEGSNSLARSAPTDLIARLLAGLALAVACVTFALATHKSRH